MLQISDQFDHYLIRSHMAKGGMSNVYKAYDLLSGKEVVLKVPDKNSIGDPAQYERFQRELEVMKSVDHPAVQKGIASGVFNNTPYLVTELIDGESMRDIVKRKGVFSEHEAVALIRKIADGVLHIHNLQIIHRDLKPENILIMADGQPVILDFGLTLTKGSHRVTYANFSSAAGTPDYMAPEQIEGSRGDNRTDIYAIGVMFFELIAGKIPFEGDNNLAVMALHLNGALPRLDKVAPGTSLQTASIVAKCLQKNPADRYTSLSEFLADLDNPEKVDTTILERATGAATARPWWKTQPFLSIASAFVILIVIITLALILQHFKH
jgi:serine/threonine-protein kinase